MKKLIICAIMAFTAVSLYAFEKPCYYGKKCVTAKETKSVQKPNRKTVCKTKAERGHDTCVNNGDKKMMSCKSRDSKCPCAKGDKGKCPCKGKESSLKNNCKTEECSKLSRDDESLNKPCARTKDNKDCGCGKQERPQKVYKVFTKKAVR